jgi:hypothetical protein
MLKEIQTCFRSERILFTKHARDEMEDGEKAPGSGLDIGQFKSRKSLGVMGEEDRYQGMREEG